jgi:hypothetical protein
MKKKAQKYRCTVNSIGAPTVESLLYSKQTYAICPWKNLMSLPELNLCIIYILKGYLFLANTWMSNIGRNPDRALRNANVYISHHTELKLLKDCPCSHSRKHGILRLVINLIPGNTRISKN